MKIIIQNPPMIDEIDAKFNVKGKPCIFAWGNTIFNPMNIDVPEFLHRHEEVHSDQQRQVGRVELWWQKYIDDIEFRLAQEIPAHRAEYLAMLRKYGDVRNNRRRFLTHTAARLAAPIYGSMITISKAKVLLAA